MTEPAAADNHDRVLAIGVVPVAGTPRVVSCHKSGLISVRELETGDCVTELPAAKTASTRCATVRELDGQAVVVTGRPGRVWCVFLDPLPGTTAQETLSLKGNPVCVTTALVAGKQIVVTGTRGGRLWIWRRTRNDFAAPARMNLFTGPVTSVDIVRTCDGAMVVAAGLVEGVWAVAAVDALTGRQLWVETPSWTPEPKHDLMHWKLDWRPHIRSQALAGQQLTVRAWHDEDNPAVVVCLQYTNTMVLLGILRLTGLPTRLFGEPPAWDTSPALMWGLNLEGFVPSANSPLALWTRDSTVVVTDFPLRMRNTRKRGAVHLAKRVYPRTGFLTALLFPVALWASDPVIWALIVVLFVHPFVSIAIRANRYPTGVERHEVRHWLGVELDAEITTVAFAEPSTTVATTPQGIIALELNNLEYYSDDQ